MIEANHIYLGDCLELMKEIPDKSIDCIITDPPYGLNYNAQMEGLAGKREWVFDGWKKEDLIGKERPILNDDEETSMKIFEFFLKEAKRILKKGACCCCCCGGGGPKPLFARWTLLMDEIIGFKQAVVWNKPGLGMGIHFRRCYEFILIAQNGQPSHRWNGDKKVSNVINFKKIIPNKNQHPTQKPVDLMRWIIQLFSNENDLVLDPFLGSGTTAVACKELKRQYIGIEKEEEYFKIAQKRLDEVNNLL